MGAAVAFCCRLSLYRHETAPSPSSGALAVCTAVTDQPSNLPDLQRTTRHVLCAGQPRESKATRAVPRKAQESPVATVTQYIKVLVKSVKGNSPHCCSKAVLAEELHRHSVAVNLQRCLCSGDEKGDSVTGKSNKSCPQWQANPEGCWPGYVPGCQNWLSWPKWCALNIHGTLNEITYTPSKALLLDLPLPYTSHRCHQCFSLNPHPATQNA